jgi:hypothetical protein
MKLQKEHQLTENQIKLLNRIEASGNKSYAKYNEQIYEPYVKPLYDQYAKRPADKPFSYPHYIPRSFFVTVGDILPNLKKKYWHGPKGTPLANEILERQLKEMAAVVENIANQTQDPDEAMNAYFSKIKNNTFKKAVNNVINNASQSDIQAMTAENLNIELGAI